MRTKLRYSRHLELSGPEFKIIKINMLSINMLMEKVDNIQEQMGNVSREMEIKRIKRKG